jgi:uncharacterized protein YjiK
MSLLLQRKCPVLLMTTITGLLLMLSACFHGKPHSPPGYNLDQPDSKELGKSLNEISGISFIRQDSSLIAVSDSKRKIFNISLRKGKLTDKLDKFYEQADFEDLLQLDSTIYVLVSNGTLLTLPVGAVDASTTVAYPFWDSTSKNDFETIYYDKASNGIIMLCKACAGEKKRNIRTAFRFDLAKKAWNENAFYVIDEKAVMSMLKSNKVKFNPSAAAVHPVTNQLYILSSAGQLLVIADLSGKVSQVYRLNPDKFPQAEGIAFAPNGDMYIANEAKYGKPVLLVFKYNRKSTKP